MKEYPKIQSLFKRDNKTNKFIEGEWSLPEFAYLQHNQWTFTEKVDGTNIRIMWDLESVRFGGKTDNAQIPSFLIAKLQDLFPISKFQNHFPETPVCLYGEGYGPKIQGGGGNYGPNVDFVLFDVLIGPWWLEREGIVSVSVQLDIGAVPVVGCGTLHDAISLIKSHSLQSRWGNFLAEGIVLKPEIDLFARNRNRVITKIKHKDF